MIETILSIAQIIFGMAFFLYLPGYFIVEILFSKSKQLEKILLSALFSVMVGMSIGVFFGYDRAQALRTGGFTGDNLWIAELLLTSLFAFIFILQRIIQRHPLLNKSKRPHKAQKQPTKKHNK